MPSTGSTFLQECASYLVEVHGAGAMSSFARRHQESLHIPWFPVLRHGMPAYHRQNWTWEFHEAQDGDYNIAIEISANGEVVFREGDDSGRYLALKLKHPFEMGEVLELIQNLHPDKCDRTTYASIPWSSIVQEIFVLAPGDKKQRLLKFSWNTWAKERPGLLEPFKVFYGKQWENLPNMGYSSWRAWLELSGGAETLPFAGDLKEDDLLFTPDEGFQSSRSALEAYDIGQDGAPRLVIRLNPQHSRMYFVDFLQLTEEGAILYRALRNHLENLFQVLSESKVEYPTTRLQQIRLGAELRAARFAYETEVQSLMNTREPAAKLTERYRMRSKGIQLLHTDYLLQIEAQQNPLPFMVEWPLRRYHRADDPLLKIRYGQQLLNILLKLPLFLVLEELRADPSTQGVAAAVEAELFAKPCSDGTLSNTLQSLHRQIEEKKLSPIWFGGFLGQFVKEGIEPAKRIITARNRYHHAPFDEAGIHAALEAELPSLIKLFRCALEGISFIVPESIKNQKGQMVVVGRPLMGYETDFPRQEFTTTAPFSAFPEGQVVVLSQKLDRALPLPQLFKVQPMKTLSVDVGVFDRMVKGHPEYVFIRGVGDEVA